MTKPRVKLTPYGDFVHYKRVAPTTWQRHHFFRKKKCVKTFYCFNVSSYIIFFVKYLFKTNVDIGNDLNVLNILSKIKLHCVTSIINVNPCGVHSFCKRPNIVYSLINMRKFYQRVNCIVSRAKLHEPFRSSFSLHATKCYIIFDTLQKNLFRENKIWSA